MTTKAPLKTTKRGTSVQRIWKEVGTRGRHTKEGENQPNVSPPVSVAHIQRGVVLITDRDGTKPTKGVVGRIIQVSAKVLDELVGPSRARLVQRWVEDGEFLGFTGDFETAERRWLGLPPEKGKEGRTVVRW